MKLKRKRASLYMADRCDCCGCAIEMINDNHPCLCDKCNEWLENYCKNKKENESISK